MKENVSVSWCCYLVPLRFDQFCVQTKGGKAAVFGYAAQCDKDFHFTGQIYPESEAGSDGWRLISVADGALN